MGKKNLDIAVKVSRVGSELKEISLNGNRTVSKALEIAGLNKKDSEVVSVNASEVEDWETYELNDGDRLVLVKNVHGGAL